MREQMNVTLPAELIATTRHHARMSDTTLSAAVEQALRLWLDVDQESQLEAIERRLGELERMAGMG